MSLIRMQQIRKAYQMGPVTVNVLNGVDLTVNHRDLLAIVGSSGCGKSTLMNILGFLDTPDAGNYFFAGQETSTLPDNNLSAIRNEKIGFVFQQFNLLAKLSALENVCLPLVYRGMREKERVDRARQMLDLVGMDDRRSHRPDELSGGQQQRVAIARALSGGPAIVLADEPTGALDTKVGQDIMNLFLQLNDTQQTTLVIITHDPAIAAQCRRKVSMKDGIIVDQGPELTTGSQHDD